MARIAVIGAGYVGLTSAIGLASLGHDVIAADIHADRIERLNRGELPIHEDGMADLLAEGIASGRLSFVLGAATAAAEADIHFMCLPTPQGGDGAADLSYLLQAVDEIGPILPSGSILVNKSTVPVGTQKLVKSALGRDDVTVVSHPEFLREGSAIHDFLHPDRIVVGADDEAAARRISGLYENIDTVVVHTDAESAELIKYASNAYLATKLTFVNEIAQICEQLGADIDDVMAGMGQDRRIGTSYLSPGPGWGGSCFPKDTEALLHIAASADVEFDFLRNVIALNGRHIERVAAKVAAMVGGSVDGQRIAAWGLTFKAGTDDLRDSPAIAVLTLLRRQGAEIVAHDPAVTTAPDMLPDIEIAASPLEAARDAQCLVVLTEWPEFASVDLDHLGDVLARRRIVDARNLLDRKALAARSFDVRGVGR